MTKELEQQLYAKYPGLFRQKSMSIRESCMPWGICTGDGWYGIIDQACKKLAAYAKKTGAAIEITQLKEKFGSIRIYLNASNEAVDKIVEAAHNASLRTCEACGTMKGVKLYNSGWVKVRCAKCKKLEDK